MSALDRAAAHCPDAAAELDRLRAACCAKQSRTHSALEATASTAIGFCVSWAATPFILAAFGYQAGVGVALGITIVYTLLSVVRGYVVRRLFNRLHRAEVAR